MSGTTDRIANGVDNRMAYHKNASGNINIGVEKDRADTSKLKEEFSLSTTEKTKIRINSLFQQMN